MEIATLVVIPIFLFTRELLPIMPAIYSVWVTL
jgi:hypothetical protein